MSLLPLMRTKTTIRSDLLYYNTTVVKHVLDQCVIFKLVILAFIEDSLDPTVAYCFQALVAWMDCDIYVWSINWYSVLCRKQYCVYLSMYLVVLAELVMCLSIKGLLVKDLVAVSASRWSSIVSSWENSSILDNDSTNFVWHAIWETSNLLCNVQKYLVDLVVIWHSRASKCLSSQRQWSSQAESIFFSRKLAASSHLDHAKLGHWDLSMPKRELDASGASCWC